MTDYNGYTREELIKEISIWKNRVESHAIAYAENHCDEWRKLYKDAQEEYMRRAERYEWVISLLAKFGIREKAND